jgi:hypothetical protein
MVCASLLLTLIGSLAPQSAVISQPVLGQPFEVRQDEETQIKSVELRIKFNSVQEDSRCPKGENCIWEGNARIELKVAIAGQKEALVQLNTSREPQEAVYQGYTIKLVSLNPYPGKKSISKPSHYVATLLVSDTSSSRK